MSNIERMKHYEPKKLMNLALATKEGQILLAMKKRGFGEGWWNGYGGKVKKGESILGSLKREMVEEAEGFIPEEFIRVATLWFEFQGQEEIYEVHLFKISKFHGKPEETEEMKPQWFPFDKIPFTHMWDDDPIWMPYFLAGEKFEAWFFFSPEKKVMKYELQPV